MEKRPLPVALIAIVYLLMGIGGLALRDFHDGLPLPKDMIWAVLVHLCAVVAAVFLWRAANWARWLALAWMLFHVVLSIFHNLPELAVHIVFCIVIAYFLFRPQAGAYFRAGAPA